MSWGAVAVAGISAVSAYSSSRSSRKAGEASAAASEAAVNFERERYNDWLETYGPIQDNLSAYYSNLSPEYYEAMGLEAISTEQARVQEQVQTSLAQRGIEDSGIAASLDSQLEMDVARQRATVRRDAEQNTITQQQNFLAIGQGSNPSNSLSNALQTEASRTAATAATSSAAAGQANQAAVGSIGKAITGLSDYYG